MSEDEPELAFYAAVEDLFATLRGQPHVLSPKDFHLMREWWRDGVPLAAVGAGLAEVAARRSARGDDDPVVSLGYCRHAIRRHAKRLAEARVGAGETLPSIDAKENLDALADRLAGDAARLAPDLPAVAAAIDGVALAVRRARELAAGELEAHLAELETVLLARCREALPTALLDEILAAAASAAAASGAAGDALERTRRALIDRELRRRLGLPRLELTWR
jgi:hypothetical protein